MGRFCAWYNHELTEALPDGENEWGTLGPQGNNPNGKDNYVFADIEGKGHFVGVNYYVHSPSPMWYGEGDDMIFIDGDETPHAPRHRHRGLLQHVVVPEDALQPSRTTATPASTTTSAGSAGPTSTGSTSPTRSTSTSR